jgi:hypothetical protein
MRKTTTMYTKKVLWIGLTGILFLILTAGCGSQKDVAERRNLMIPKKSEMPKNNRYKEVENRKSNKIKINKSRRKSLF